MSAGLARRLAEFAAGLRFAEVPPDVVECAKGHLLDTLGVALAGREEEASRAVRSFVEEWGGPEQATILGEARRLPAASAALVNGTYAHAKDFDDSHNPSVVHPSAPLVPAVLAQAEASGAGGTECLTALVAGYEVLVRLAMAQYDPGLRNSTFFERGFHATSIIGALAAAVACARLRGLPAEGVAHALAVSCSMAAGILEANRSGGTVKQTHCGWAAHCGVAAAGLAAHGVTGPATVLEGGFGFFPGFCGERWTPEPVSELGRRWDTLTMAYKPYPCNGFTHAVVDAALALKRRGLGPEQVERVEIGTAAASRRTIGEPIEEKRRPRSPYHAEFSGPFVFACALVGGGALGVALEDFTDRTLTDPVRRRIAERCDVVEDPECTRVFPTQLPAVVRVWTTDGRRLEERAMVNRGSPQRPLSREELLVKLRSTAGEHADRLAERVSTLERAPGVRQLLEA
jgi:2-methylcitrate dehydratase PrpD